MVFDRSRTIKDRPLEIPINGKKYKTNVLDMTISPKLPDDVDRGIWIRLINFQGVDYILFEQRQPGEFKRKDEGSVRSYSISTEDVEWSELHIDKIERMGIEIKKQETRPLIQSIDTGSVLYKLIIYAYKPLPSFKGQLTLDKSFVWDAPDKGHLEIVRVKN